MENGPEQSEKQPVYEISILDTTKQSALSKLAGGSRLVFVVYAGKIVVSADGLHTTITKNLGIQENSETYFDGVLYLMRGRKFCGITKKENGQKEEGIECEPEGINIEKQLLEWFGLKS